MNGQGLEFRVCEWADYYVSPPDEFVFDDLGAAEAHAVRSAHYYPDLIVWIEVRNVTEWREAKL